MGGKTEWDLISAPITNPGVRRGSFGEISDIFPSPYNRCSLEFLSPIVLLSLQQNASLFLAQTHRSLGSSWCTYHSRICCSLESFSSCLPQTMILGSIISAAGLGGLWFGFRTLLTHGDVSYVFFLLFLLSDRMTNWLLWHRIDKTKGMQWQSSQVHKVYPYFSRERLLADKAKKDSRHVLPSHWFTLWSCCTYKLYISLYILTFITEFSNAITLLQLLVEGLAKEPIRELTRDYGGIIVPHGISRSVYKATFRS